MSAVFDESIRCVELFQHIGEDLATLFPRCWCEYCVEGFSQGPVVVQEMLEDLVCAGELDALSVQLRLYRTCFAVNLGG